MKKVLGLSLLLSLGLYPHEHREDIFHDAFESEEERDLIRKMINFMMHLSQKKKETLIRESWKYEPVMNAKRKSCKHYKN